MAQIVKLRRSSVSGQKPTNTNLQLGELALNTTDGKVYMAKSGSLGPSVEELISTNTVNTGSIHITDNVTASFFTGSFIGDGSQLINIPSSGVTGLELYKIVSGSVSASISPDRGLEINTDVTITGSIHTTDNVTASNFTGSFNGDGSQVYNIPLSGVTNLVTISGSFDDRLETLENTTSSTNVNYIDFDTTPSVSPIEGRLLWNSSDGTLDLGMKGGNVVQQIGQEIFYEVRNETGTQIPNGTAVYANGVTVGSGRITVAPFTSNGTIRDINFLGLATENISNGVNGYVTHFGYTRGLDTRGTAASSIAVGDENWSVGDILYAHPTAAGKLTNVKPKHEISVAIIINRHQSSGVVFVRPTSFGHLFDNHDVDINTGSITTGDLLIYDSGNSVWKNSKSLEGDYSITGSLSISGSVSGDGSGLTNLSNITGSIGQVAILDSDKTVTSSWFTHVNNQTFGLGTDGFTADEPERLMVDNYNSINIATFQTSQNETYAQVNVKNFGSGSSSSSDFVLWNDVTTEEDNYVDLGLNSSNYTDGFLGYENDGYLYSNANDLYVGSYSTGSHGHLHLFGGGNWDSSSISIYSDNTIGINTDKRDNQASTIPSSIDGYAVEISGSVNFRNNIFLSGSVTSSLGVNTPIITNNGNTWEFGTDGKLTTPGDVNINGILTAKELHIDYVTSSVLYESGSTNFGNTSDDTHSFTGSVNITGSINVDSITGSINFSNLTNVPTLVSGSSQISYTGITDTPSGIVSGSSQIVDLGFLTTGSFESYTSSVETSINNISSLTSSFVLNSETASMTVLSSSYAVTASYALSVLGGDGSEGRTAKMEQSAASTTWTFNHYLGERFPAITVFNSDGFVIIPTNIEAIDTNQLEVTFSSAQSGYITATVGGGLPAISGSYGGRVLAIDGSSPVWKENIVSGSLQISNLGFSTTGSNSFNGNQTITGSLTIANTKMGSLCTTSTGDTIVLDLGDFDGATIDYIVKYNSNRRFGTIMGVWDGAQYEYNEVATMDIGNTSDISFNIDANGNVHAVSTLNTWEVTLSYRALGC